MGINLIEDQPDMDDSTSTRFLGTTAVPKALKYADRTAKNVDRFLHKQGYVKTVRAEESHKAKKKQAQKKQMHKKLKKKAIKKAIKKLKKIKKAAKKAKKKATKKAK